MYLSSPFLPPSHFHSSQRTMIGLEPRKYTYLCIFYRFIISESTDRYIPSFEHRSWYLVGSQQIFVELNVRNIICYLHYLLLYGRQWGMVINLARSQQLGRRPGESLELSEILAHYLQCFGLTT